MRRSPLPLALGLLGACSGPDVSTPDGAAPDSDWWSAVQPRLEASEYRPQSIAGGGFRFWNRVHGVHAEVTDAEVTVSIAPVDLGASPTSWQLRTDGFGRDVARSVGAGTAKEGTCDGTERLDDADACIHRVEVERPGLVEWWVNDRKGLEQGWRVEESPPGEGPLAVDLALTGVDVQVGEAVAELRVGGERFLYKDVHARDATGAELAAWFEPRDGGLRIRVQDAGAQYPVEIDPVLTYGVSTLDGDWNLTPRFGSALASAGDVNGDGYADAIVGGTGTNAQVSLFLGSKWGLSVQPAWTASGVAGSEFGHAVSGAGDVNGDGFDDVVVSATAFGNGHPNEGRLYLFFGSTSGLAAVPAWTLESNITNGRLGMALAAAGDVNHDGFADVLVNSDVYSNGRVEIYAGSATGLGSAPIWSVNGPSTSSQFGRSMARAGDVNGDGFDDFVIGHANYLGTLSFEGAARVYLGTATGVSNVAAWGATGGQAFAVFGSSVTGADVNDDGFADVIVGSPNFDNGEMDEGRVSVFLGSASGLAATPAWTAEGNQIGAGMGAAVAPAGDLNGDGIADVAVGLRSNDDVEVNEGQVRVYLGATTGLATSPAAVFESDQVSSELGTTLAGVGDVNNDGRDDLIAGAPLFDVYNADDGRVFVYLGSVVGIGNLGATTSSDQGGSGYGTSVASAGDVNGDGFSDAVVGAPNYDGGEVDEGRAWLFLGSPVGLASTAAWMAESNQAGARFGASVAPAGDLNGDGFGDFVVGAPTYDDGEVDEGAAFVFVGASALPSTTPAATLTSDQAGANFGVSVSSAGDANGDGYADLVVGANLYDNGHVDEGAAFVYRGSASGVVTPAYRRVEANQTAANLGVAVASAGDVNGDGYGDVVVGANLYDNGQVDEGAAFLYLGASGGVAGTPSWTGEVDQTGSGFGGSVSSAGDTNGDGFSDVIVGARGFDNGSVDEGGAFVFFGAGTGLAAFPNWIADTNQTAAAFGASVASVGDVNGDGYGDVAVGAPLADVQFADEGRAYVYYGSASGPATAASWTARSGQAGSGYGASVTAAGDVDGDGFGDVLVGGANVDVRQADDGVASVFYGAGAGPRWPNPVTTLSSGQVDSDFGSAAAGAGDVNGDGFDDAIVGAPLYRNGQTNEGRAYLYLGSATGLVASPAWMIESDATNTYLGSDVASAGDVNGDGFADVLVGAFGYANGQASEGRFAVYHGSSSGLAAAPAMTVESDQVNAALGRAVASAGDVNGDGFDDVVIGNESYVNGGSGGLGRAYVYLGSPTGLVAPAAWTIGASDAAYYGSAVASAGDVNGDGYGDVIVGGRRANSWAGSAYLYLGSAAGLRTLPSWTFTGAQTDDNLGAAVGATDVNGDGFSDLLVGAPGYDGGVSAEGRVYVFLGSAAGASPTPAFTIEADKINEMFGAEVTGLDANGDGLGDIAIAGQYWSALHLSSRTGAERHAFPRFVYGGRFQSGGDINGDGFGDVLCGDASNTETVRLFVGNSADSAGLNTPIAARPQARRPTLSTPIAPGLLSTASGAFDARLALGRGAGGRGWVRLAVEVKPRGVLFDGAGLARTAWTDSGIGGVSLNQPITGLLNTTSYHWRARVENGPANGGAQPWGPWLYGGTSGDAQGNHLVPAGYPSPPDAVVDLFTVGEGATAILDVLANDTDPNGVPAYLSYPVTVISQPAHGVASVDSDGVHYTHDGSETTSDSFTYKVCDPTLRCDQAVVTLAVTPANDPPTAVADTATVAEGGLVNVSVLANDLDVDSVLASTGLSVASPPAHGTAVVVAGGIRYTHGGSENTSDVFTYIVSDGTSASLPASVTVTITPANDAPVAVADADTVTEGGSIEVFVLANDTDTDSVLTYPNVTVTSATNGAAVVGSNGVTFTQDGSEGPTASFSYRVSDGSLNSNVAIVSLDVVLVNDAPIADPGGPYTVDEGSSVPLTGAGSRDPDGTIVEWAWDCTNDGFIDATGQTTAACTFNDEGQPTIGLTVTDDGGRVASATAAVTVRNVAPAISSLAPTTASEGVQYTYAPVAVDPGADTLVWSLGAKPSGMTVEPSTGKLAWTPDATHVSEAQSLDLYVSDGDGGTDMEHVTIVVAPSDLDNDGLSDVMEGSGDPDNDGVPNLLDTDSDGDGILDGEDGNGDIDGDGIADFLDLDDTDGTAADPDADGLTNGDEATAGTNPDLADTDGDGYNDGDEVAAGTDPLDVNDYPTPDTDTDSDADADSDTDSDTDTDTDADADSDSIVDSMVDTSAEEPGCGCAARTPSIAWLAGVALVLARRRAQP